jgi:hypothetical protein
MVYKNKNNLDLEQIANLLKKNNINCNVENKEIIVTSNGIVNIISCSAEEIKFETYTPNLIRGFFFGIGIIISIPIIYILSELFMSDVQFDRNRTEFRFYGGMIMFLIASYVSYYLSPIFYKIFFTKVLTEKKRIMSVILNPNLTL